MKKITIAILTALMLGAAQAEYVIKHPIEQAQGGSLPNGSVNIRPTNQPPSEVYECIIPKPAPGNPNYQIIGICEKGILTYFAGRENTTSCSNVNGSGSYYFRIGPNEYLGTCTPL